MTIDGPIETTTKKATLPPRWFIRVAWVVHRAIYRLTGGRMGLRPSTATTWGMLRMKTVGRKSGRERLAILGYFEDGPNLVTLAMNGWGAPEPAWWLNLQASPETTSSCTIGPLRVRGRSATARSVRACGSSGAGYDGENLDGWARVCHDETAVVILEPIEGGDADGGSAIRSGAAWTLCRGWD